MCLLALSSAYGVLESTIRDNWSIFWSRGLIPQISYYPIKHLFRYLRIRESNVYVVFVFGIPAYSYNSGWPTWSTDSTQQVE